MKVLIIATWFFPDTAVAAKRPFYFAKYLSQKGHDVTVLSSGLINRSIDLNAEQLLPRIRVISYMKKENEYKNTEVANQGKSKFGFLPKRLRNFLANVYNKIFCYKNFRNYYARAEKRWESLKKTLIELKENGETFDVIFSTFGEIENVWAGKLCKELFACPWTLDFRDHLAAKWRGRKGYKTLLEIEQDGVNFADACTTVSLDLSATLQAKYPNLKVYTVQNGYDKNNNNVTENIDKDMFSFSYTGMLHAGKTFLTPLFKALNKLIKMGLVRKNQLVFNYAGSDFNRVYVQAQKYKLDDILVDHGYVSREKSFEIQTNSDIFVVASWNTKEEKGILTGKFYEGIQANKPILSVVSGKEPNSELFILNEKYDYGYCYEQSNDKKSFNGLMNFLAEKYAEKMTGGKITHQPKKELFEDFKYENLTKKLEKIMLDSVLIRK